MQHQPPQCTCPPSSSSNSAPITHQINIKLRLIYLPRKYLLQPTIQRFHIDDFPRSDSLPCRARRRISTIIRIVTKRKTKEKGFESCNACLHYSGKDFLFRSPFGNRLRRASIAPISRQSEKSHLRHSKHFASDQ